VDGEAVILCLFIDEGGARVVLPRVVSVTGLPDDDAPVDGVDDKAVTEPVVLPGIRSLDQAGGVERPRIRGDESNERRRSSEHEAGERNDAHASSSGRHESFGGELQV